MGLHEHPKPVFNRPNRMAGMIYERVAECRRLIFSGIMISCHVRNKNHSKKCEYCECIFATHRVKSRFCSHSCAAKHKHRMKSQIGENNPNFKGSLALSKYQHKKRWRLRNPEKAFAHDVFAAAIRAGKITRKPCEICSNHKTDAHHDDYSKPLEVIWLCRKHHAMRRV